MDLNPKIILNTCAGQLTIQKAGTHFLFTLDSLGGKGAAFTKQELCEILKSIINLQEKTWI